MSYESVQEMFSRQAAKLGGQVAIDRSGRRVTYQELEAQSNRLANFLLDGGVSKGTMVGLFTDDPIKIITGILGVLKAGAVFVPLDPTFPEQRLRVMSDQVQPLWYVTEDRHVQKLDLIRANNDARIICLDHEDLPDRAEPPGVASDPDAPCSIYFTSGSTGKPKAILGRLKGIDHFMRWEIEAVKADVGTRVSQLASPSFDGFLKDAFVPLCSGGVVCAPESRDIVLDAWSLADWLDVEEIEVLHCVPSLFRALLNEGLNSRYFEAMKYVVMTGEPLYPADVKRWLDVFGDRIRLLNIYGTTETSLSKFTYEVKPEDVDRPSIPVGKPIAGSNVLLVNARGRLCDLEAVGEIHIQTPYRSHGYYGEPELTKEVFIQNPFSDDPNDIVHKTGDFGRLLEDGSLEILGRRDAQVKVRGVRVELGEIENLLRGHQGVADVAVVDRDDAEGNKFLVVYATFNNGGSNGAGTEQLREYLAQRLPQTMLPSAFVELDQLPRTLNGKIDRKALPALELIHAERDLEAGTMTPLEEIVAGIWCEVLRLPSVNRTSNFFSLGGHSLLVMPVLSRIRENLQVELPIRSMFEAPTIAEFAQLIEREIGEGKQSELTTISRVPRDGELPLSHSQQRMWFFEQLASGANAFNVSVGVRMKGCLNGGALEQTCGEIIRRHESMRTVFQSANGQPLQVIQPPRPFKLPVVDLTHLAVEEREDAAVEIARGETLRRFDLANGPLVRLALVRLSDEEHIILCTIHHIISDGQSFEVVVAEMSRIYSAIAQGKPSPLPELAVQYVDYAAWQRQWLQGDELERRLAYWRRQLADAPKKLTLPQRRASGRIQKFQAARRPLNLSPELTQALREFSRQEGVTLLMTMLSGFALLLNQYTGDEDVVVGTTYANRERPEAEHIIGILANTLVLRVDVSEGPSFRETLRRVKQVCLDAYSYQVPPELLREDFSSRGADGERLFEVWFQLERLEREKLEMEGLECEWYARADVPRFELSMVLAEQKDDMVGQFEYDVELFDEEIVTEMLRSYVALLEEVTAKSTSATA